MKEVLLDKEFAEVYYESDLNVITVIWRSIVDSKQYKETFEIILKGIGKYDIPLFLSDTRKQGVVDPKDRKWLETEIIPAALKAGLKYTATVLSKDIFKKYYLNKLKDESKKAGMAGFGIFDDFDEAKDWLMKNKIKNNIQ
ncbi:MAG: hypothetical protein JXL97_09615 [Bacteroidales bacterium]|nr:hypothetical protein [Bacteroidales bacterium]